ncbi:hypothetical protein [Microbacterium ulmi]|uniref:Uncharacterized protein n=1 Tax=Microbacterium ulmi TaxID=179095 RepID=A0A7Y2LZ95_9MICO|nr:hypothetical protein [Microbacterium ulmi]NII68738.1 hypothetical protein [Microbacterium ulmi]NNH03601.1 hypothetical protein [Microbacterium ulmi]
MTLPALSRRRLEEAVAWTGAGFVTSMAALCLMLGIAMIALGASDTDPSEGLYGWILGAIGLGAWLLLVVAGGCMLTRRRQNGRLWRGVLPGLVSVLWSGLAALALTAGWLNTISSLAGAWPVGLAPVWSAVAISLMTLGTIPIGLTLLVVHVALRLMRARMDAGAARVA